MTLHSSPVETLRATSVPYQCDTNVSVTLVLSTQRSLLLAQHGASQTIAVGKQNTRKARCGHFSNRSGRQSQHKIPVFLSTFRCSLLPTYDSRAGYCLCHNYLSLALLTCLLEAARHSCRVSGAVAQVHISNNKRKHSGQRLGCVLCRFGLGSCCLPHCNRA